MMWRTECKRLRRPYQGSIQCSSSTTGSRDDERDVTVTCTVACQDGFAFSGAVLEQYACGPETGYLWPHESPDNPRALLPACTGKKRVPSKQNRVGVPDDCSRSRRQLEDKTIVLLALAVARQKEKERKKKTHDAPTFRAANAFASPFRLFPCLHFLNNLYACT